MPFGILLTEEIDEAGAAAVRSEPAAVMQSWRISVRDWSNVTFGLLTLLGINFDC